MCCFAYGSLAASQIGLLVGSLVGSPCMHPPVAPTGLVFVWVKVLCVWGRLWFWLVCSGSHRLFRFRCFFFQNIGEVGQNMLFHFCAS